MNTRILFVDDETFVLQGLQRLLRPQRAEWHMTFCESGVQALAHLQTAPFDVVVSDMRMPGMNGAQLLGKVMHLHPKTVRIILSGHADRDLILQCVGSTHQYLSKPCEPDQLRAVIRRTTSAAASQETERLKQLVGGLTELPTVPELYSELVSALHNADTMLDDIGRLVERDPATTVKLLRLVNSAYFGLRREIASATEAVNYLGIDTIKSIVVSTGTFAQYESLKFKNLSLEAMWKHSFETASCARFIARSESAGRKIIDESFAAGLLHDVGKLILAANFNERYVELLAKPGAEDGDLAAAEREAFGTTHADVAGYVLGLWGLPVPVVQAITLHHDPKLSSEKSFTPLTALHAANAIVRMRRGVGAASAPCPLLAADYLAGIGLEHRLDAWREGYLSQAQFEAP